MTGGQDKIDAFLNLLSGYDILEIARTGIAGLRRGTDNIVYPHIEQLSILGFPNIIYIIYTGKSREGVMKNGKQNFLSTGL